jgi:ABC-2 type transport system permease protein
VASIRLFGSAAALEFRLLRSRPFEMFTLLLVPIQTVGFVAIFRHAARPDLDVYGVVAPALIALWQMALIISGEVIARERDNGSLESLAAAPGRMETVLIGRVSVVTVISLIGLVLSALTGWIFFGITPTVRAPLPLVAAILSTAAATLGTALLFSVFFVNSRSPRIFQNAMTYPFYVLGGVLVPIAVYPGWVHPLSHLVFLSWSADLVRDSISQPSVAGWGWRCAVVLGEGLIAFLLARWLLSLTLRNARQEGKLGLSAF